MDIKSRLNSAHLSLHNTRVEIFQGILSCIKKRIPVETKELERYIRNYPNDNYDWYINFGGKKINGLHLSVLANDFEICKYMIDHGATPQSNNVYVACRNGNAEMVELLLSKYVEPQKEDIVIWKKTAVLNGHNNIASLIDRLLNRLYIKFSQSDTSYFLKIVSNSLKNILPNHYIENSPDCRPTKIILEEIHQELSNLGYMKYSLEYLNVLKRIIRDSLSISKFFHSDSYNKINDAINYYKPYKDGLMEIDKRTTDGSLLVVM